MNCKYYVCVSFNRRDICLLYSVRPSDECKATDDWVMDGDKLVTLGPLAMFLWIIFEWYLHAMADDWHA